MRKKIRIFLSLPWLGLKILESPNSRLKFEFSSREVYFTFFTVFKKFRRPRLLLVQAQIFSGYFFSAPK